MATILVDYENVFTTDGLKGAEYLKENDTLIIFYSQCCEKIRAEYIDMIEKSKCGFKTYKLAKTGKNALDFYIAVECGYLSASGVEQVCIVSRDKGFSAIADFFRIKSENENVTVHVAPNIEKALSSLNASEDVARRRLINEKSRTLNIDSEQARIKEHREFVNKIIKTFEGTEYEKETDNILRFIEKQDAKTPRILYTGSLHEFGREDGRAIYQMLKNVV
ncbi:MAG: hypothetical protein IJ439_00415 [Tyzzerella sp.]|nr:hypothetical protein [Tyzzerella sp.]